MVPEGIATIRGELVGCPSCKMYSKFAGRTMWRLGTGCWGN